MKKKAKPKTKAKPKPQIRLASAVPILNVASAPLSVEYYCNVLGFKKNWGCEGSSTFASVSRDGVELFLCENGQGQRGNWIYINVSDVDQLHEALRHSSAKIKEEPNSKPWCAREMLVEDLDGHVLRFGMVE